MRFIRQIEVDNYVRFNVRDEPALSQFDDPIINSAPCSWQLSNK